MTHTAEFRRILQRMGYYNYQNGLIYRHLNQEGGWDEHLMHCRKFILKAIEYYNPSRITILGSGWLLELPLSELVEKKKKICLVDIVHPPEVISQAGSMENVELIEHDVTGGLIEEIWYKSAGHSFFKKLRSIHDIHIPEYKPDSDPGMVISLNLLTQLESILTSFLRKRSKIGEEEYSWFKAEIQKKHIDFLKKHSSVLITDIAEVITRKSGSTITTPTLLTDLPEAKYREEWTWDFDKKGSDYYNSTSVLKVAALTI